MQRLSRRFVGGEMTTDEFLEKRNMGIPFDKNIKEAFFHSVRAETSESNLTETQLEKYWEEFNNDFEEE